MLKRHTKLFLALAFVLGDRVMAGVACADCHMRDVRGGATRATEKASS